MKRGHSRHSYPFDKMLPRAIGDWYNKIIAKTIKKMHIKKQRQYNKKLENDKTIE